MKSSSGLLAAVLLAIGVPVWAQSSNPPPSLAELAKKAQDAKKASPTPAKTFTNEDLKKVTLPPDPGTIEGKDAKDSKNAKDKDAKDATADDAKKDAPDPAKDEKAWRDRMNAAREDLRRNQAFKDALQSRINGLTADFTARDDPYQRAQIADERQKALAELDRVTKAIDDGNKAIAQIEEDARKAMVPPGWIR